MGRGVGIFVSVVVVSAAGLLGLVVWAGDPHPVGTPRSGVVLDAWNVLYDTAAPSFSLIVAAFGLAVLAAMGIAAAERVVTNRSRRSTDSARRPLAPRTIMAGNRGEYAGPVTITVLVPAHNEQASVGATLVSLFEQSRPPERIIVVADNCTDDTARIARRHGAEVVETIENTAKKAVRDRGPLTASDLSDPRRRDGEWWGRRSEGRQVLEWLFGHGEVAAWRAPSFERVYDLPQRAIPAEVLATPHPSPRMRSGRWQHQRLLRT